ncbi:endochitinase-like [Ornithodoros turicata]|uniref:endochitinase-like n=1 Tax=Ornithodoros turicata TaxID=34597 RepID=UPI003138EF0C
MQDIVSSPAHSGNQPRSPPFPASPSSPIASPPFYSLRDLDTPEESEVNPTRARSGTFVILLLISLMASSLVLPIGLVLLHFMRGSARVQLLNETSTRSSSSLATTTKIPEYWQGLPSTCLQSAVVSDNISGVVDTSVTRADTSRLTSDVVFCCIYNVSRFRKPKGYDYLPRFVPFHLCPCLVYWSLGIDGGRLVSRAPEFDKKYGLRRLGALKRTWNTVLLTVGGFPEDSFQFARLGWNTVLTTLLSLDILDTLLRYKLDGVNIHWTFPSDSCGRPDDGDTLLHLLNRVKELFHLNSRVGRKFQITLMVPGTLSEASRYFDIGLLRDSVDFFFFDTKVPSFFTDDIGLRCTGARQRFRDNWLAISSTANGKACFSATVMFQASIWSGSLSPLKAEEISNQTGLIAVYELCAQQDFEPNRQGEEGKECEVYEIMGRERPVIRRFFVESKLSYIEKFGLARCVVVYDIDFDDFRSSCLEQDFGLRRIWKAVLAADSSKQPPK